MGASAAVKSEEFVATLLVRPLLGRSSTTAVSGSPSNTMEMELFVVLTTNMKKSPKHELGAGSVGRSKQRTLVVKSSNQKLASLSTNPGNARIQIKCPQTPSGLLDVS